MTFKDATFHYFMHLSVFFCFFYVPSKMFWMALCQIWNLEIEICPVDGGTLYLLFIQCHLSALMTDEHLMTV